MRDTSISVMNVSTDCRRTKLLVRASARGFQELRLFNRLSARDNIEAAIPNLRGESIVRALIGGRGLRHERLATDARSKELLRELTINSQADVLAERLSYGQQKLLSLGRLLAAEGELLLLDEPTSGLSPQMVEDFCAPRSGGWPAPGKQFC